MNHLYLALGRAIAGLCPAGFAEARLQANPDEGAFDLNSTMADGTQVQLPVDEAARAAIRAPLDEIREAMAAEDGKSWRSCTVTLIAGGGFRLDVAD